MNPRKLIVVPIKQLQDAVKGGRDDQISEFEQAIADCLEDASKERSFYALPVKNIISIIQRSNLSHEEAPKIFSIMKIIFRSMSDCNSAKTPLLLHACDFPHLLLDQCVELISCLTKCKLCIHMGYLNNLPKPDHPYIIAEKDEVILKLKSEIVQLQNQIKNAATTTPAPKSPTPELQKPPEVPPKANSPKKIEDNKR